MEGKPDPDNLRFRLAEVRAEVEYLRAAMHHWGGNSVEMSRTKADLRDAQAALEAHSLQIDQLSNVTKSSQASIVDLRALLEGTKMDAARSDNELRSMARRGTEDVGALRVALEDGLFKGKVLLETRSEELHSFIRTVDREHTQRAGEVSAWQIQVNAQLRELDVSARSAAAAFACAARAEEDVAEHRREQAALHAALEESLRTEAQAISERNTLCVAELHRLIGNLEGHLKSGQEQLVRLVPDVAELRADVASVRDWAAALVREEVLRLKIETERGLESLDRRVDSETQELARKIGVAESGTAAVAASVAETEVRLRDADAGLAARVDREATACRSWAAEQIQAEIARVLETVNGDAESQRAEIAAVEERLAAQSAALTASEQRLAADDRGLREQLAGLGLALQGAEARLEAEDRAVAQRLEAAMATLAAAEARLTAESAATKEQLQASFSARASVEGELRAQADRLSTTLAEADARLRGEYALVRERVEAFGAAQKESDARNAAEQAAQRGRLDALATALAASEAKLKGEYAMTQESVQAVAASVASLDDRLCAADGDLGKRIDVAVASTAASERRLASEDAALRERLEAHAEKMAATDSRLAAEVVRIGQRLEDLAVSITGVEGHAKTEAAALGERVEALAGERVAAESRLQEGTAAVAVRVDTLGKEIASVETRLSAEDAAVRERMDAVAGRVASWEPRLQTEVSALQGRMEAISAAIGVVDGRLTNDTSRTQQQLENISVASAAIEGRLRGEISEARARVDELRAQLAAVHSALCADNAATSRRIDGVAHSISESEGRLTMAGAAARVDLEQRFKEEVAWLLSIVQHAQQTIDQLAYSFRGLGHSHERRGKELKALEQVVRDVEVRAVPWRAGVNKLSLEAMRAASPNGEPQGGFRRKQPLSLGRPHTARCETAPMRSSQYSRPPSPQLGGGSPQLGRQTVLGAVHA